MTGRLRRHNRGEAERIGLEAQARRRARYIWERSGPASKGHLYLTVKRVGAHGLREYKGSLVVPLYDALGVLHSLQFIAGDGRKRFLFHGRVEGCFCGLGQVAVDGRRQTVDSRPVLFSPVYRLLPTHFVTTPAGS